MTGDTKNSIKPFINGLMVTVAFKVFIKTLKAGGNRGSFHHASKKVAFIKATFFMRTTGSH